MDQGDVREKLSGHVLRGEYDEAMGLLPIWIGIRTKEAEMARFGRHGMGKILTDEKMAKIYCDYCNHVPRSFLCEKYGLSKASITKAISEMQKREQEGKG